MLRSLFSGVSGVTTQQAYMDVIANNIANVNTTGYKSGRITFADTFSQTLSDARGSSGNFGGVNPVQIGLGTRISSIDTNFTAGSLESTGITTDLAVNGDGFFIVGDGNTRYFTRAGAFQVDSNGMIIAQGGQYFVQGRMADEDGNLTSSTSLENIVLPFGKKDPAHATENVDLYCNLNREAATTEQWLSDSPLEIDGTAVNGSGNLSAIDLANIDGVNIQSGDVIQITGTDRDGNAITVDFTYGTTGTTLQDLVNSINTAFNSSDSAGATVIIDDNGYLRFTANEAGPNDFSFALIPPVTVEASAQTHTSTTAWTTNTGADNATSSTDLANIDGSTVTTGTTLTFDAVDTDGTTVALNFVYGTDGTNVGDLINFINANMTGVTATLSNGSLVFTNNETGADVTSTITSISGGGLDLAFSTVNGTNATSVSLPSMTQVVEGATGEHSTEITVYDSQGGEHNLVVNFTQDNTPGSNFWTWDVVIDNGEINPTAGNSGTVSFNEDGSLKEFLYTNGEALTFNVDGAQEVNIQFNAGTSGAFDGITQFASASTTIAIEQDGYTLGQLSTISVDEQGIITGYYSNGQSKTLAQIALATFTNQGGLKKEGDSLYSENSSTGNPIINWGGSNASSTIRSGYLESSNVDLTKEFTNMIVAQHAIQANAKTISTADTILSTVIERLKRM